MEKKSMVEELLKDRDLRVEYQRDLVYKYKMPLVCIRVNYPGINKDNEITKKINEIIHNELINILADGIIFANKYTSLEGPISIFVINDTSIKLKELCVNIEENHPIGRLVDIDVYDENYWGVSRTDLGKSKRKCFICDDLAFICSRARKHSEKEIINYIENTLNNYLYNINRAW